METKYLVLDASQPDESLLLEPSKALRRGELVVFPTETVYGLGANALLPEAVPQIYQVKGRPSDNPLILHIAAFSQVDELAAPVSDLARFLLRRFWPGPLTAVLPKRACVPDVATAGLPSVGLRMPSNPIAATLLRLAGVPVAAPSANVSGRPSPTTGRDCLEDLRGRVPFIIEGGPCTLGLESTVVDLTGVDPVILRPGFLTREDLQLACEDFAREAGDFFRVPQVQIGYGSRLAEGETPRAPGMKYRHYAPKAPVVCLPADSVAGLCRALEDWWDEVCGANEARAASSDSPVAESAESAERGKLGKLAYFGCAEGAAWLRDHVPDFATLPQRIYGTFDDQEAAARELFAALRGLDREQPSVILTHDIPGEGVAAAYRNRLHKAASGGAVPGVGDDGGLGSNPTLSARNQ